MSVNELSSEDWAFKTLGPEHGLSLVSLDADVPEYPVKLFAVAPNTRTFVAAGSSEIVVGSTAELASALQNNTSSDLTLTKVPHKGALLVEILPNESQFVVYDSDDILSIYTLPSAEKSWSQSIPGLNRLYTRSGSKGGLAYSTVSGGCSLIDSEGTTHLSEGTVGAWSWSGSEFITAKDETITHGERNYKAPGTVLFLKAISETTLFVVTKGEDDYCTHYLVDGEWLVAEDVCQPWGDDSRTFNFYLAAISSNAPWNVYVVAAAQSTDVILGSAQDIIKVDEGSEATLPFTTSDTSPVGIGLDLQSDIPVVTPFRGVDKCDPMPILFILTNEGSVVAWQLANKEAKSLPATPDIQDFSLAKPTNTVTSGLDPTDTPKSKIEAEPVVELPSGDDSIDSQSEPEPEPEPELETKDVPDLGNLGFSAGSTEKKHISETNGKDKPQADVAEAKSEEVKSTKSAFSFGSSSFGSSWGNASAFGSSNTSLGMPSNTSVFGSFGTTAPGSKLAVPSTASQSLRSISTQSPASTGSTAQGGGFGSFANMPAFGSTNQKSEGSGLLDFKNLGKSNDAKSEESPFAKFAQKPPSDASSNTNSSALAAEKPSPFSLNKADGDNAPASLFKSSTTKADQENSEPKATSVFGSNAKPSSLFSNTGDSVESPFAKFSIGNKSKAESLDTEQKAKGFGKVGNSIFESATTDDDTAEPEASKNSKQEDTSGQENKDKESSNPFGEKTSAFSFQSVQKAGASLFSQKATEGGADDKVGAPFFGHRQQDTSAPSLSNNEAPKEQKTEGSLFGSQFGSKPNSESPFAKFNATTPQSSSLFSKHPTENKPLFGGTFSGGKSLFGTSSSTKEESSSQSGEIAKTPLITSTSNVTTPAVPSVSDVPKAVKNSASPAASRESQLETEAISAEKRRDELVASLTDESEDNKDSMLPFETDVSSDLSPLDLIYAETNELFRVIDHNIRVISRSESAGETSLAIEDVEGWNVEDSGLLSRKISEVDTRANTSTDASQCLTDQLNGLVAELTKSRLDIRYPSETLEMLKLSASDDAYNLRPMPLKSHQLQQALRQNLSNLDKSLKNAESDVLVARARSGQVANMANLSTAVDAISQRVATASAVIDNTIDRLSALSPSQRKVTSLAVDPAQFWEIREAREHAQDLVSRLRSRPASAI